MNGPLPQIDSRASFAAALLWALQQAHAQSARRLLCVSPDFADWTLDEPEWLDGMTAWLRLPQRRLVLLARSFDDVPRRYPRFERWRANWSHAIEGWQAPEELSRELPSVLVTDGALSVQLIDAANWRGRVAQDARRAQQWREDLDVVLQRSERALAVRTLGL